MTTKNIISSGAWYNEQKERIGLERVWNERGRTCCVLMYYPSTADAINDDETVKRCIKILQQYPKIGRLLIYNINVENTSYKKLMKSIPKKTYILVAWGNFLSKTQNNLHILNLRKRFKTLLCFDINKTGTPKLPTRMSITTKVKIYK